MARTLVVLAAAAMPLAACGGAKHPAPARRVAACVPAPVRRGPTPAWTSAAWSDSSGPPPPAAFAPDGSVAGYFFAPFLRAGHPTNPANKILWIVRYPRNGDPLVITARSSADPGRVVRIVRMADSSPGEIYPSYVDLPAPGCWRLSLRWGAHAAQLDVEVHPAAMVSG